MTANTHFAVAVHAVTALAHRDEPCLSTEAVGGSVDINAVVIRRILSQLREAGIVEAQAGKTGGSS